MKRSHLIAVLVGFMAIVAFANIASAYYHAGMGRFLSRDPGPMRMGSVGMAAVGQFVQRDPYADGMNLYQYVRTRPTRYVDPAGLAAQPGVEYVVGAGDKYGKWFLKYTDRKSLPSIYADYRFRPRKDTVCCDEIALVQIARITDAKTGALLDDKLPAEWKARRTQGGWWVDRLEGKKYGWYGLNNDGTWDSLTITTGASDLTRGGKSHKFLMVTDTPAFERQDTKFEFVSCAVCRKGKDQNTIYGCLYWGGQWTGTNDKKEFFDPKIETDLRQFNDAVKMWNSQATGGTQGPKTDPNQEVLPSLSP